ncbi:MAG: hypothetical protein J6Y53_03855 [Alphaproteobacteria bacterium]|nr:hypothetical protein [Alphaproteobacteria bacterium]
MKKIYIVTAILMLSGCASMFSGTKETIIVQSEDRDAKIYIGEEYAGTGAGVATISKKKLADNVTIRASKKGCRDSVRHVETKIDATTFLGCLIDFCVVTVGVVDWLGTGAIREAAQTNYFVTPICEK